LDFLFWYKKTRYHQPASLFPYNKYFELNIILFQL
jgi:hypothetical protein